MARNAARGIESTDQLGRVVTLPCPPRRIVSLVPSQTELLFDLGLDAEIVGVTKFCVHPAHARTTRARVGGTKDPRLDRIADLVPDLILANKEENREEDVNALAKTAPVWVSDINTLDQAIGMIGNVGELVGKARRGTEIAATVSATFNQLVRADLGTVGYLIWRDPYMVAGSGTLIHDLLIRTGFDNRFAAEPRYPTVSAEQLASAGIETLLLSSEPYPFGAAHVEEFQTLCPEARVMLVDGEMFSWFGSRLTQTVTYLESLQREFR